MTIRHIILFFVSIAQLQAVESYIPQPSNPLTEPWRWVNYPEASGKGITCVAEDPEGTMWFGGDSMVLSYDGEEWREYVGFEGIEGKFSIDIIATRDGSVYVSTNNTVVAYIDKKWVHLKELDALTARNSWFYETGNGSILMASVKGIVEISQKAKRILVYNPQGVFDLTKRNDQSKLADHPGFVTGAGIALGDDRYLVMVRRYQMAILDLSKAKSKKPDAWTFLPQFDDLLNGFAGLISPSYDGKAWIYTANNKVPNMRYDPETEELEIFHETETGASDAVIKVTTTTVGDQIFGCNNGITVLTPEGEWKHYDSGDMSLKRGNYIVLESSDKYLWVVAQGSEVYRVDYFDRNCYCLPGLIYATSDSKGVDWYISQNDRVVAHDSRTDRWISYGPEDGLPTFPDALLAASTGLIYVGGRTDDMAAVSVFEDAKWTPHLFPNFGLNIAHDAIAEGPKGKVYMTVASSNRGKKTEGIPGGFLVHKKKKDRWNQYSRDKWQGVLLRNQNLGFDTEGTLWFGSFKIGYVKKNTATTFNAPPGLASNGCVDMAFSDSGEVWVVKPGKGVFYTSDAENWTHVNASNGLPSNIASSVLPASDGSVWVSTDEGIARFDGESWLTHAFTEDFVVDAGSGDLVEGKNGVIWINTYTNGWFNRLNSFNYSRPWENMEMLAIRYTSDRNPPETTIQIDRNKFSNGSDIPVSWMARDLKNHTASHRLQFSYQVDDGPWSAFSNETGTLLKKLSSGRHRIAVKARDSDFNVDPTPAVQEFKIQYALWQQWWFILMVIITATAITYLSIKVVHFTKTTAEANKQMSVANQNLETQKIQIADAFEKMNAAVIDLATGVEQVANMSNEIADNSEQVNGDSETVATGAMEQSKQLRSVAEDIKELQNSSKLTEDASESAKEKMDLTSQLEVEGTENMSKLGDTMAGIQRTANKTQDIIKSIEEIAEQTNLLALNAAIESARAGVEGRRFGVIADEIAVLAKKSAAAAHTTEELIHESVSRTSDGVSRTQKMSEQLEEIREHVEDASETIHQIATSSTEQHNHLQAIAGIVDASDRVTQKNAGAAMSLSESAQSMSEHAEHLRELVQNFKDKLDMLASMARDE